MRIDTWRHDCPVLVTEAETMGAIGVIRSLGRSGPPVHACARSADALGFRSRYRAFSVTCPEYGSPDLLDLIWDGCVLAEFQHRRPHEVPHAGGISSFRVSFENPAIKDDALAKIQALQWRGVGMLEYRLEERSGKFHFSEFNGRFWGSLHLALFANGDFPTLLLDAFHGHPQEPPRYRPGVKCWNTFPQEIQYVWSRLEDRGLSRRARAWSILEFLLLSIDPRAHKDLLYPGDRHLWTITVQRALRTMPQSRLTTRGKEKCRCVSSSSSSTA